MLVIELKKRRNKAVLETSDGKIEIVLADRTMMDEASICITAPKEILIYRENQQ